MYNHEIGVEKNGQKSTAQSASVELKMSIKEITEDLTYANIVYFLPNTPNPIPPMDTQSAAKVQMGELFEYGSVPGNSLKALENLLTYVYLPLFQAGAVGTRQN